VRFAARDCNPRVAVSTSNNRTMWERDIPSGHFQ
jgi:hypothetical protein